MSGLMIHMYNAVWQVRYDVLHSLRTMTSDTPNDLFSKVYETSCLGKSSRTIYRTL